MAYLLSRSFVGSIERFIPLYKGNHIGGYCLNAFSAAIVPFTT